MSVAWGDVDGDGDLDLAAGNGARFDPGGGMIVDPDGVHLNKGGLLPPASGEVGAEYRTPAIAIQHHVSSPAATFSGANTLALAPADGFAVPQIRQSGTIRIKYTLHDPVPGRKWSVRGFYSPDGGGRWRPAYPLTGTVTAGLAADHSEHVFEWDVLGSGFMGRGFMGRSDDVVFRLEALPSLAPRPGSSPGLVQQPRIATRTYPFRVRGHQVRVMEEGAEVSGALVYRVPAGERSGGEPLADRAGIPFKTDANGYLLGRGELGSGDRLLALAPQAMSTEVSATLGSALNLYHTSARPTRTGLDAHTISAGGVQTLNVSDEYPLLLFDLDLSLEWDASEDPLYLQQLDRRLKRASEHLYDFTNGQVALGKVTVYQNADDWLSAHVAVRASNHVRPFAVQGGAVVTRTVDVERPDIVYDVGQISMGASWNRYGNPVHELGDDWAVALAHELGHYLLFLDDTYLGLDDNGLLIPIRSCTGSAMGDVYSPANTEFVPAGEHWTENCADTLTHRTLGRSEWQTIKLWYPFLKAPMAYDDNPGPRSMPFEVTTVTVSEPFTATTTVADSVFFTDYKYDVRASSEARAYLLVDHDGEEGGGPTGSEGFEYVVDLGTPLTGQNRVIGRGAQPGNRLCVFDPAQRQFGCEVVSDEDERLILEHDESWTPQLRVSPVTTRTVQVEVSGVASDLPLRARLYPEFGLAGPAHEIALRPGRGVYTGTFELPYVTLAGHVQLWVDEPASDTDPRREALLGFAIGGNPGPVAGQSPTRRGAGHQRIQRGGGPMWRGAGASTRGRGAPVVSADGQLVLFTENPEAIEAGDLYTLHAVSALPPLPADKTAVGQGFNLVTSPGTKRVVTGSIAYQYMGTDVLAEGLSEEDLRIHHWDGAQWQVLTTAQSTYFNSASSPNQGEGLYALLAGVTIPQVDRVTPNRVTNEAQRFIGIRGGDFLAPVSVTLSRGTEHHELTVVSVGLDRVETLVPAGLRLPVGVYTVVIENGDGGRTEAVEALAVAKPEDACFADRFESGAGQWHLEGDWGVVALSGGSHALTDSPGKNYDSAVAPTERLTTTVTSPTFSLLECVDPILTFRHDYVLSKMGASRDVARVEVSRDNGQTWTELAQYSGGRIYDEPLAVRPNSAAEWADAEWRDVAFDLGEYGGAIQLRFILDVDEVVSDRGWLLDDVVVRSESGAVRDVRRIYLPSGGK